MLNLLGQDEWQRACGCSLMDVGVADVAAESVMCTSDDAVVDLSLVWLVLLLVLVWCGWCSRGVAGAAVVNLVLYVEFAWSR